MFLVLFILFLTSTFYLIRYSLIHQFHFLSNELHSFCLLYTPINPQTSEVNKALVCGHNFESLETSKLYISAGLIHLFVVSGSHLTLITQFLDFILNQLKTAYPKKILFLILTLYAFICLLNPPLVRSLIHFGLQIFLKNKIKYWPSDYTLLLSGALCLMISPDWIISLSLQMSWIAALAIEFNQRFFKFKISEGKNFILYHQFIFYIFFTISFSALGRPELSVLVVGFFFIPFMEFILLPGAFLAYTFPFTDFIFEKLIFILNSTLSFFELQTSQGSQDFKLTLILNWTLIISLHIYFYLNRPAKT